MLFAPLRSNHLAENLICSAPCNQPGGLTAPVKIAQFPDVIDMTRRSRWHETWRPKREPITEELLTAWRDADPRIYEVHRAYRTILGRLVRSAEV